MRVISILLLCFTFISISAQDHIKPYKLNDEGILYYDFITENEEMSKNDFFIRSQSWIVKTFGDAQKGEMFSDREEGVIVAEGEIDIRMAFGIEQYFKFIINIYCKEGRARIVIDKIDTCVFKDDIEACNFIEKLYWKRGDTNNKILTGSRKGKAQYSEPIIDLVSSWESSMMRSASGGYSDF